MEYPGFKIGFEDKARQNLTVKEVVTSYVKL